MKQDKISKAASLMGKKGGRAKWEKLGKDGQEAETQRLRAMGKKGGWPKGKSRKITKGDE